jgi:hypothetical protein
MWTTFCGEENVDKVDNILTLRWDKAAKKGKKYRKSIKIHRFLKPPPRDCGQAILPQFP